MEQSDIRTVMMYGFLHGTTASQTTRNIDIVFGSSVTTQLTALN